jgi:Malectin domain/HYDIN/CFA65/VesB-like, Ig-like domain
MCLVLAGIALAPPASAGTFTPIRMHAGGRRYTDSLGQVWSADADFTGGQVYRTTSPVNINNTADPALYQTERYGLFSYKFAVPNGSYNVVLKFAEIYFTSVGQRVFNVSINGTPVLTDFDIIAAAGAPLTAIEKTFPVMVTNGAIVVQFIPGSANWPKVSAIELVPSSSTTVSASTTSTSTLQGQLSLNETSFAFGDVDIGTTASQTFTMTNTGTATITFSNVNVSGAGFNATGASSGVMLNPGQSTTLTATFTPAIAGNLTGSVAFTSNAVNPAVTIALSGTGVKPPPVTHSVVLTWKPSSSSNVTSYHVYRGATSAGPFTILNTSPVLTTSYTDNTVQANQVYYYVVTSVDSSSNESAYSNAASATIP